jgi:hypothetical protein
MWIGVQTSIFSEGFFRGNINSDAITFSLKCSQDRSELLIDISLQSCKQTRLFFV